MGRAEASVEVPGLASDAEALWYDPIRWPAFVDGFGHLVEISAEWPAAGTAIWHSAPGGRERVIEREMRSSRGPSSAASRACSARPASVIR